MKTDTYMTCHADRCITPRSLDKNGFPRSIYCNKHLSHYCTHGHPTIKTATQRDPRVIGCSRAGKLWAKQHEALLERFKKRLIAEGAKTPTWIDSHRVLKAASHEAQFQFMLRRSIRLKGIDSLAERLCGAYVAVRYASHSWDLIKIPDGKYFVMTKWAFDQQWPQGFGRRGKRLSVGVGELLYKITEEAVTQLNGIIETRLKGTEFEALEGFSERVIKLEVEKLNGIVPKNTWFKFKARTEEGEANIQRAIRLHRGLMANLEMTRALSEVVSDKA